jgi:hypothetical protein
MDFEQGYLPSHRNHPIRPRQAIPPRRWSQTQHQRTSMYPIKLRTLDGILLADVDIPETRRSDQWIKIDELQASTLDHNEGCKLTIIICGVWGGSSFVEGSRVFPFAVPDEVGGDILARHKRTLILHIENC